MIFVPQPYPIFLADATGSRPLVGRIVGWSVGPDEQPQPVVMFEDGGRTRMPLVVSMAGDGRMWVRDSVEAACSALAAAEPDYR